MFHLTDTIFLSTLFHPTKKDTAGSESRCWGAGLDLVGRDAEDQPWPLGENSSEKGKGDLRGG